MVWLIHQLILLAKILTEERNGKESLHLERKSSRILLVIMYNRSMRDIPLKESGLLAGSENETQCAFCPEV